MQLTERHYARWISDYDDDWQLPERALGEVPADLLARLEAEKSCPESCPESDFDTDEVRQKNASSVYEQRRISWSARRESNPRPSAWEANNRILGFCI